jgi:hypothetical protein
MQLYHLAIFVLVALIFLQLCRNDKIEGMSSQQKPAVRKSESLPCVTCTNMQPGQPATMVCPQDCNVNTVYDNIVDSIKNTPVSPMSEPSDIAPANFYCAKDNLGEKVDSGN